MVASRTLIGIFLDSVAAYRKPDLFIRKTPAGWESISSDHARADVESLGLALRELGVQPGDRVALLSENRYEWPVVDLAVLGLGAVTVPIYPTLMAPQVCYILENCEARVVVVSSPLQLAKVREVAGTLPALQVILSMEPLGAPDAKVRPLAELIARGAELRRADTSAFERLAGAVQPQDLATIIYTSGTTGDPKGAMLTHDNVVSNVRASLQVITLTSADKCLSFLPLCHIFERMAGLYCMLWAGCSIAYAENVESVAANAIEVRPTVLNGVPRFYEKVYARVMDNASRQSALKQRIFHWGIEQGRKKARAHFQGRRHETLFTRLADRLVGAKIRERVGGRLRFCVSGGAPLPPPIMEFFFAIGIPVIEGYGLTETSPVICLNREGQERPGSVGHPVPGVEVKIGAEGEVVTRGPHVMKGYFRNPAATEAAIRDGWFHTGDVGRFDETGRLHITDRIKDLLVTAGGKKVAPQPIEAKLKATPWIAEAVLLGDARPYVVALLVPNLANLEIEATRRGWSMKPVGELLARPEVRELFQAEIDRANESLAPFERIKQFAILERELSQEAGELTPTLKVKRRVVTSRCAALIDGMYVGHQVPGAA